MSVQKTKEQFIKKIYIGTIFIGLQVSLENQGTIYKKNLCRKSIYRTVGQSRKPKNNFKNLYRKFVVGLQVNLENQEPIYSKKIMQDIYLYDCRSVQKTKKQFIKKFYIVRLFTGLQVSLENQRVIKKGNLYASFKIGSSRQMGCRSVQKTMVNLQNPLNTLLKCMCINNIGSSRYMGCRSVQNTQVNLQNLPKEHCSKDIDVGPSRTVGLQVSLENHGTI